jgi:hypothetical protein
MRFQIDLKIHYDSESGKAEVKSIKVASGPQPFQAAVESARDEVSRESLPESTAPNILSEARHLAGQLGIDEIHITDALSRRPQGRVIEVLRWMKKRRAVEAIRNAVGLFHTLVAKD